jgi:hypothetical protein
MAHDTFFGSMGVPGISSEYNTVVADVEWGTTSRRQLVPALLASTTVDAGNTPTTLLRPGLILGRITASGLWKEWNPTGTDGSQWPAGILLGDVNMLTVGVAAQRWLGILISGNVKAKSLIVPGEAAAGLSGKTYEYALYNALGKNFLFDTPLPSPQMHGKYRRVRVVTADTAVVAADSGTLFVCYGGSANINFTLPAMLEGLEFGFYNAQDYTMTITSSPADKMIAFNEADADSIAFSTAGELIGAAVDVVGTAAGLALTFIHTQELQTQTVAD